VFFWGGLPRNPYLQENTWFGLPCGGGDFFSRESSRDKFWLTGAKPVKGHVGRPGVALCPVLRAGPRLV